jgi:regulator of sigma E protease
MELLENIAFILEALFALGFTIFIHELGHFLAARKRGLVIKRFSIGFGPRIFGWTRNGVEYRLSAIPFGGYVALPQLVDMGRLEGDSGIQFEPIGEEPENEKRKLVSSDDEQDEDERNNHNEQAPLPKISYTDKMIVSVMGAVFNVLLAFVLSCILWQFGYDVSDAQLTTKVGYVADTVEQWNPHTEEGEKILGPAKKAGILPGDEILTIDEVSVENFMDVRSLIVTGKGKTEEEGRLVTLMISRNGEKKEIEVFPTVASREEMREIGIGPKHTFFIGKLSEGMPGKKVGLEEGDQPVSIDGIEIHSFNFLYDYLQKQEANETVSLTVRKGGEQGAPQTYAIKLTEKELQVGTKYVEKESFFGLFTSKEAQPVMGKVRLIGFKPEFKVVTTYPNPIVLITRRVKDMYHTLSGLVSRKSDVKFRNMSGPVGIVENLSLFAQIDFKKLLWFVVFINVNLAILNLLPIPVLDGGHMLFATIEKIRGKPLPLAFLERTQMLFVVLLFSFMLYVTFFDVQRIFQ